LLRACNESGMTGRVYQFRASRTATTTAETSPVREDHTRTDPAAPATRPADR
jgi:hypothetical protein